MNAQGRGEVIVSFLRRVIIIVLAIFGIVGLLSLLAGWHTLQEYGEVLVWAGLIVFLVTGLTSWGGTTGRAEDIQAYSLTGAGKMSEHLQRFAQHLDDRLGGFLLFTAAAAVVVVVGYLMQVASAPK